MNDERWVKASVVPTKYLKKIEFGNLKGKSDISPQWRIKVMSEIYGMCGEGWYYDICDTTLVDGVEGKKIIYVKVALYVKNSETKEWSKPIYGVGGDMVIDKNKNGLVDNDEAYKMAVTDALGKAMTYIGVASEVYEGNFDGSKYGKSENAVVGSVAGAKLASTPKSIEHSPQYLLRSRIKESVVSVALAHKITGKYFVSKILDMTDEQAIAANNEFEKLESLTKEEEGVS